MYFSNSADLMIYLIKSYLSGEQITYNFSEQEILDVLSLAKSHDIAHIISLVLNQCSSENTSIHSVMSSEEEIALYRYAKMDCERACIYNLFESNKIPFIPLKGSVIYKLYPEPWHRTSCDIDILIPENTTEAAIEALQNELDYKYITKTEHDISFMSPSGVHFELHYTFHEKEISTSNIWGAAYPIEKESFQYIMPDELLIFCHISHMAKHFRYGGCGIRPFIDLYIMKQKIKYNLVTLTSILQKHNLKKFSDMVFDLIDVWFGEKQITSTLKAVSEYIIKSGTYGSIENRVAIGNIKKKGKLRYTISRLFLPYEALVYPYPYLKKHKYLLPFCQIDRWIKLLHAGKLKNMKEEININNSLEKKHLQAISELLDLLEID